MANNNLSNAIRSFVNGNSANSSTPSNAANQGETNMRKNPYSFVTSTIAVAEKVAANEVAHPLSDRAHLYTMDKPTTLKGMKYGEEVFEVVTSPRVFMKSEAEIVGVALGIYDFLDPSWTHDPKSFYGAAFDFTFEGREYEVGVRAEKFAYGNDDVARTRFVHYKAEVVRDDEGNGVDVRYVTPLNYNDSRPTAVKAIDPYNARLGLDNKFYSNRYWTEFNGAKNGEYDIPLIRENGVWSTQQRPPMLTPWSALLYIALIEETVENDWGFKLPPFHFTDYSFSGVARGYEWAAKHWGKQAICVK